MFARLMRRGILLPLHVRLTRAARRKKPQCTMSLTLMLAQPDVFEV